MTHFYGTETFLKVSKDNLISFSGKTYDLHFIDDEIGEQRLNFLTQVTQLVREGTGFPTGMKRDLNEKRREGKEIKDSIVELKSLLKAENEQTEYCRKSNQY